MLVRHVALAILPLLLLITCACLLLPSTLLSSPTPAPPTLRSLPLPCDDTLSLLTSTMHHQSQWTLQGKGWNKEVWAIQTSTANNNNTPTMQLDPLRHSLVTPSAPSSWIIKRRRFDRVKDEADGRYKVHYGRQILVREVQGWTALAAGLARDASLPPFFARLRHDLLWAPCVGGCDLDVRGDDVIRSVTPRTRSSDGHVELGVHHSPDFFVRQDKGIPLPGGGGSADGMFVLCAAADGDSLASLLAAASLGTCARIALATQALAMVTAWRAAGLVHCDLKADQFIVSQTRQSALGWGDALILVDVDALTPSPVLAGATCTADGTGTECARLTVPALGGECFDTFADASVPIDGSGCGDDGTCPGFADVATAQGMWHSVLSPLAQGDAATVVKAAADALLRNPSNPDNSMAKLMEHAVYQACEQEALHR